MGPGRSSISWGICLVQGALSCGFLSTFLIKTSTRRMAIRIPKMMGITTRSLCRFWGPQTASVLSVPACCSARPLVSHLVQGRHFSKADDTLEKKPTGQGSQMVSETPVAICLTPKPGEHEWYRTQLSQALLVQCRPSLQTQMLSVTEVPSCWTRSPRLGSQYLCWWQCVSLFQVSRNSPLPQGRHSVSVNSVQSLTSFHPGWHKEQH